MALKELHGRGHAVVLGGSMAGLLAARVLADHFDRVTVVERDPLPGGPAPRRGVPQGSHTHGLIAAGGQALERLFPGITQTLTEAGGVMADPVRDFRWYFEGGRLAHPASGLNGVMVSRPLLEAAVRNRVRALAAVTFCEGTQAVALRADAQSGRVTGVQLASGVYIDGDLVVDASGRGSRSAQWLQSLGYPTALEERVEIGISYTTRLFRREARHAAGDAGIIIAPTPTGKRGGVMLAQEQDRWTVTLISHFLPPAGESLDDFRAFARQLPASDIHDVIHTAEPIGEAVGARFPASVRRRYERLERFPEGLVIIGDALCSFNPIYGQGMSVAALEALALGDVVGGGRTHIGRRFFRAVAPIIDNPWTTAVGNDLRIPEAVGPRTAMGRIINAYIARLHRAGHRDERLALAFLKVANLLASPASLLAPPLVIRTLMSSLADRPAPSRAADSAPSATIGVRPVGDVRS